MYSMRYIVLFYNIIYVIYVDQRARAYFFIDRNEVSHKKEHQKKEGDNNNGGKPIIKFSILSYLLFVFFMVIQVQNGLVSYSYTSS
jgi:hypothetical protein